MDELSLINGILYMVSFININNCHKIRLKATVPIYLYA